MVFDWNLMRDVDQLAVRDAITRETLESWLSQDYRYDCLLLTVAFPGAPNRSARVAYGAPASRMVRDGAARLYAFDDGIYLCAYDLVEPFAPWVEVPAVPRDT